MVGSWSDRSRIVNDVSAVLEKFANFAWQAQYLVMLEGITFVFFCHASHAVAAHPNKMLRRLAELILFVRGPLQGWHGSANRRYRIQTV